MSSFFCKSSGALVFASFLLAIRVNWAAVIIVIAQGRVGNCAELAKKPAAANDRPVAPAEPLDKAAEEAAAAAPKQAAVARSLASTEHEHPVQMAGALPQALIDLFRTDCADVGSEPICDYAG